MPGSVAREQVVVGRYALYDLIASGGMGRVYLARVLGAAGFSREVAVKRLHPNIATDPQFVAMLLDEARICSRIHHPNVVSMIDVVDESGEFLLVMEYVPGVSLHQLLVHARGEGSIPSPEIVATIFSAILRGLHAAHEATNDAGSPLQIVHRDVSPQNVLVTEGGGIKVLDFGIAKAQERLLATQSHVTKGKPAYMAPEQLSAAHVDRRADVYAVGVMLWEVVAGQRLFTPERSFSAPGEIPAIAHPSSSALCFGAIAARALENAPDARFQTALEMAEAIEAQAELASPGVVGEWARAHGSAWLEKQRDLVSGARSVGGANDETTEATPPAKRRWPWAIPAVLVIGVGAFAVRARYPSGEKPPSAAVVADVSSVASALAAAPPAAPSSAPVTAPAPPASSPPRTGGRRPKPPTPAAPTVNCNPPYTVDSRGTKVPKRECL